MHYFAVFICLIYTCATAGDATTATTSAQNTATGSPVEYVLPDHSLFPDRHAQCFVHQHHRENPNGDSIWAFQPIYTIDSHTNALCTLNNHIKSLNEYILRMDAETPLDSATLNDSKHFGTMDLYRNILSGFYDLQKTCETNVAEIHLSEFGPLAETFLNMVKKRCLYARVTNLSTCAIPREKIDAALSYYKEKTNETGTTDDFTDDFIKELKEHGVILPNIIMDESVEWREKRDAEFSPYFSFFKGGIDQTREEGKLNYIWFMHFIDYVSDLTSTLLYHSFHHINTGYPSYFYNIGVKNLQVNSQKFPSYEEFTRYDTYKTNLETMATSSLYQMLGHAPGAMLLPYPFDLDPMDFLNTTVKGEQLFFPCGFIFRHVMADGWVHCPRQFFAHDIHHAAVLAQDGAMRFIFMKEDIRSYFSPDELALWQYVRIKGRQLYIMILEEMSRSIEKKFVGKLIKICGEAKTTSQDPTLEAKLEYDIKIAYFLAFHWAHESRYGMLLRVIDLAQELAGIEGKKTIFDFEERFLSPSYYLPLLPKEMEKLPTNKINELLTTKWADFLGILKKSSPRLCSALNTLREHVQSYDSNFFIPYSAHLPTPYFFLKYEQFMYLSYRAHEFSLGGNIKKENVIDSSTPILLLFFRDFLNLPEYATGIPHLFSTFHSQNTDFLPPLTKIKELPPSETLNLWIKNILKKRYPNL